MVRNIDSNATAHSIGVPAVRMRHWAHVGFTEHLGERVGKTTMYAVEEIGELATAVFLHARGVRMRNAFAIARASAQQIKHSLSPNASGERFIMVSIDPHITGGYSAVGSETGEIRNVGDVQAVMGLNLERIVGDALERLKEFTRRGE